MTFDSNSDLRATFPRFTPEARKANQPVVASGCPGWERSTAFARAARRARSEPVSPFFRFTMALSIGAAEIELASADLREIESAFAKTTVQGARLSEEHMKLIDRKAATCELVFSVPD